MNISHTIRVLLADGRCQRHYVEAVEPHLSDYMDFHRSEWIGWSIGNNFYLRENVTGFCIEPFEGIIVDVNGFQVICNDPDDLPIVIRSRQIACGNEINALEAYLKGLGNVHTSKQHAGIRGNPGDSRPEGSDSEDAR